MKKFFCVLLSVLVLAGSLTLAASAMSGDDLIAPCFYNTATVSTTFFIDDSGLALTESSCVGITGVTTGIVIESKIERKFGLIWLDVKGAEWTDSTSSSVLSISHSIQLNKSGTYRVTADFTVSGNGHPDDEIRNRVQDSY